MLLGYPKGICLCWPIWMTRSNDGWPSTPLASAIESISWIISSSSILGMVGRRPQQLALLVLLILDLRDDWSSGCRVFPEIWKSIIANGLIPATYSRRLNYRICYRIYIYGLVSNIFLCYIHVVKSILALSLSLIIAMPDLVKNWSLGCRLNIFLYFCELVIESRVFSWNFISKQPSDKSANSHLTKYRRSTDLQLFPSVYFIIFAWI